VTAAALLDRVQALAVKLGPGLTKEDVELELDVHLARDDAGFSGVSRSWPARVLYVPALDQKEASLHVSFDDFGSVTIADLEKRFGPAEYHVDAKQGLARYRVAPDTSLRAKYLGGWNPSSRLPTLQAHTVPAPPRARTAPASSTRLRKIIQRHDLAPHVPRRRLADHPRQRRRFACTTGAC
jgi:hypothetical protein